MGELFIKYNEVITLISYYGSSYKKFKVIKYLSLIFNKTFND